MIFSKIHSFSKPVPLPPVRKWQTDLPETRKCAVSPTKIFTNSLFGLCCCPATATGANPHHVRRRPERLNCLRPSPSARLQFVQKVNRLHFLRRLHFLCTVTLRYTRLFDQKVNLIRSGLNPFRINPK